MALEHYIVETTLGSSILQENKPVYVMVNRQDFVKKNLSDVRSGEMALYEKVYAKTELDDVIPHLFKSPRYEKAREIIFEKNTQGDYIPKLRSLLIRGLAKKGVVGRDDLENKILREDRKDFKDHEYEKMTEYLRNSLLDYSKVCVAEETIEYWLRGLTLSPRNWDTFEVLSEDVNPAFKDWKPDEERSDSMYFNYRLYCTIHSGIMRFLNNCKGTSIGGPEREDQKESKISLSPEIQIVMKHFMRDVSDDYAVARITDVKRIENDRQLKRIRETDYKIGEGLESNPLIGREFTNTTYNNMIEEYFLLEAFLRHWTLARENLPGFVDWHGKGVFIEKNDPRGVGLNIVAELFTYFKEPLDNEMNFTRTIAESRIASGSLDTVHSGRASAIEKARKERENMFNEMVYGKTDKEFGFEKGTCMNLIENTFQTRLTLPKDIWDCLHLRVGTRELNKDYASDRKFKKLRNKIKESYRIFIDHRAIVFMERGLLGELNFIPEDYEKRIEVYDSQKFLRQIKKDLMPEAVKEEIKKQKWCKRLWTRNEALEVLTKYGVEEIIDLRKEDFIFDGQLD